MNAPFRTVGILAVLACAVFKVDSSVMVPERGVYVGAYTDDIDLVDMDAITGVKHVVRLEYMKFPEALAERDFISAVLAECKTLGGIPLLTLETQDGLDMYSLLDVSALAQWLASYDMRVILRWNHEMNGNWYVWGQRPAQYVEKFREFVSVVRQQAPRVEFAFTPNPQFGYPWGGRDDWTAEDLALLDTNGDGRVDDADDAFSPYFPGTQYVDWIGMSFFWWGYPYSTNTVPIAGDFALGWVNFNEWASVHAPGVPQMIPETGAFFDPLFDGDSEADIKNAWVQQIYDVNMLTTAPSNKIKLICWLNTLKVEKTVNGLTVDWRLTKPGVVDTYKQRVNNDPFFVQRTHAPTASPSQNPTMTTSYPVPSPTNPFPTPQPTSTLPTPWPSLSPSHPPRPPTLPPFKSPAPPRPTWPRDDDGGGGGGGGDGRPSRQPSLAPTSTIDRLRPKNSQEEASTTETKMGNASLGILVALAAFLGTFALLQLGQCALSRFQRTCNFFEELDSEEDEEDDEGDEAYGKEGSDRNSSSEEEEEYNKSRENLTDDRQQRQQQQQRQTVKQEVELTSSQQIGARQAAAPSEKRGGGGNDLEGGGTDLSNSNFV